jgi:hypothetical protein
LSRIAFIDLEASGLGTASWPIEVGWCFTTGRPDAILIKPDEDWAEEAWDPAAEILHGISRKKLARSGKSPGEVCARVNQALAGARVYSDAPDWDGFWLYRLFSAVKMRQAFKLLDFADLFDLVSPEAFAQAKEQAQAKAPHRHRARDDVLHMRLLYEFAGAVRGD